MYAHDNAYVNEGEILWSCNVKKHEIDLQKT